MNAWNLFRNYFELNEHNRGFIMSLRFTPHEWEDVHSVMRELTSWGEFELSWITIDTDYPVDYAADRIDMLRKDQIASFAQSFSHPVVDGVTLPWISAIFDLDKAIKFCFSTEDNWTSEAVTALMCFLASSTNRIGRPAVTFYFECSHVHSFAATWNTFFSQWLSASNSVKDKE